MAIRVLCRATVAAFVLSIVASAQTPIHEHSRCGGVRVSSPTGNRLLPLEPRNFAVGVRGLCSEYATSGWEATMHLHLGEGAEDHLHLIEMAVDRWNTALMGFSRRPVINIIRNVRPKTFRLESRFWQNGGSQARTLVDDGQSVIYFKASESAISTSGFAQWRWDRSNRLRESDIYINTQAIVEYGPHLIDTQEVLHHDESRGVFAMVDSTYLTILHEIGHALGLYHVPIAGNIMSYNYMPRMMSIWNAPLSMLSLSLTMLGVSLGTDLDAGLDPFLKDRSSVSRYMYLRSDEEFDLLLTQLYTESATLGEQDRMALMCIYDFEDWNDN